MSEMIVGKIKISNPYLQLSIAVTHFTPRKSTAIEWMILEILNRFGNNSDYKDISLDKLFKIVQISDSDDLVKPCMITLKGLGAISSDSLDDNTSLSQITLQNVSLTPTGMEMQKLGLLPGVDRIDYLKNICYDLLNDKIVGEKERKKKKLSDNSSGYTLYKNSESAVPPLP
jgi:hypothetical protein